MTGLIIACVRAGPRYPLERVSKLRDAITHHFAREHTIVCLTDQPERCEGVVFIDITEMGLHGVWAKMLLFEPSWRTGNKVIYFDLGTDIVGDITPLAAVPGEFAIHGTVMVIGAGMASFTWTGFDRRREELMAGSFKAALKQLHPDAPSLQRLLPKGFFHSNNVVGGASGGDLYRVVLEPR